jgi:hypothetical protein
MSQRVTRRRVALSLIIAIGLGGGLLMPSRTRALAPDIHEVASANIVVDGDAGDWDLGGPDLLGSLFPGGDVSEESRSAAYARYDCTTGIMYVLVLDAAGWVNQPTDRDNYVKMLADGASGGAFQVRGNDGNDGTPPDFQDVPDALGRAIVGWEASFTIAEGDYSRFVIRN